MAKTNTTIHAEAGLHRKLILFAQQLELYLARAAQLLLSTHVELPGDTPCRTASFAT